jgi:hypothetical protein
MMICGLPNRPFYFYQKDIIGYDTLVPARDFSPVFWASEGTAMGKSLDLATGKIQDICT